MTKQSARVSKKLLGRIGFRGRFMLCSFLNSSGLQIRSRSFPVEVRIEDESVRDWIVRFLHYWGFPIVGVRIEQGVLIPTRSEPCAD